MAVNEYKITVEYDAARLMYLVRVFEASYEGGLRSPWKCIAARDEYPHESHFPPRIRLKMMLHGMF